MFLISAYTVSYTKKCTILINKKINKHLQHAAVQVYHIQAEQNADFSKQIDTATTSYFRFFDLWQIRSWSYLGIKIILYNYF